jgi:hypothetical protein
MSNILTDEFPTAIEIDGEQYEIRTDFKSSLRTILAFEDPELTPDEMQQILIVNLYIRIPENMEEAVKKGIKFLNCGNDDVESRVSSRLYSFSQDANFIFAAFQQTHKIDLEVATMHWWKFFALFMDLGSDTVFCNLTGLRDRLNSGEASDQEKKLAQKMQSVVELRETYEPSYEACELEDQFMQTLTGGE